MLSDLLFTLSSFLDTFALLILGFFLLNRNAVFSKLNIHSVRLVKLSEKRKLHLGIGGVLLTISLIITMIQEITPTTIWIIGFVILLLNIFFELFGFAGIFKPINHPNFVSIENIEPTQYDYLTKSDVVGIFFDGEARAYPIEPLKMAHIVNDSIGEIKFVISHCALCNTSHVYNRIVNDNERYFHPAVPVIQSNLVLVDQFGDLWQQITGKSLLGTQDDLEEIEYTVTSWKNWKNLYPETLVMDYKHKGIMKLATSWFSVILKIQSKSEIVLFPTTVKSNILAPKTPIIGVVSESGTLGISLDENPNGFELNTEINGLPVFVYYEQSGEYGAYIRKIEGLEIELNKRNGGNSDDPGQDQAFDSEGRSISISKLEKLKMIYPVYWFAWKAYYPASKLILKVE